MKINYLVLVLAFEMLALEIDIAVHMRAERALHAHRLLENAAGGRSVKAALTTRAWQEGHTLFQFRVGLLVGNLIAQDAMDNFCGLFRTQQIARRDGLPPCTK